MSARGMFHADKIRSELDDPPEGWHVIEREYYSPYIDGAALETDNCHCWFDPEANARGRDSNVAVYAGCHGLDGEGKPHIAPPMVSNTSLRLSNPGNLLTVRIDGAPEQRYPNGEVMQEMPGFYNVLSKQELVDLSNFIRSQWGGRPDLIKSEDIDRFLN